MTQPNHPLPLLKMIQAQRATTWKSLAAAGFYALQVIICATILLAGYRLAHAQGVYFAIVSACLVVQPALDLAIGASATRIAANIVGCIVGILIATTLGEGEWQTLVALAVVVLVCELLHLDLGMRTACVSVTIVMLGHMGQVRLSSEERCLGVLIGCILATGVQYLGEFIRRRAGWNALAPNPSPPKTPVQEPTVKV